MSKRSPPSTRDQLLLRGAVFKLEMPNGQTFESGPADVPVAVERPDLRKPWHSPDWSVACWNGVLYKLSPKQRMVVVALWKAWEEGTHFLSETYLLNKADSDQPKLSHLFKKSAAWGNLVVRGELHGGEFDTFCLAPPPPSEE